MRLNVRVLLLAVTASIPILSQTETDAAVADFSSIQNPNGVWSYGYSASLGAPLFLFTAPVTISPGIVKWGTPGQDPSLDVGRNTTGVDVLGAPATFYWPKDMLHMHPSSSGQYAVVRWTALRTGTFNIQGTVAVTARSL
jgi:hypothetical protein